MSRVKPYRERRTKRTGQNPRYVKVMILRCDWYNLHKIQQKISTRKNYSRVMTLHKVLKDVMEEMGLTLTTMADFNNPTRLEEIEQETPQPKEFIPEFRKVSQKNLTKAERVPSFGTKKPFDLGPVQR